MSDTAAVRTFEVRHVQLARAAFAAIAAVMITFSPDHSAIVGVAVFSGFAIATALVHLLAAWLVYPAGARWPSILLGIATLLAGMAGGLTPLRTTTGFFALVVTWAIVTGIIETVAGARGLRALKPREVEPGEIAPWSDGTATHVASRGESRDALVVGVLTVVLGLALLCVPTSYALQYTIEDAHATFTLTGIIIAVGIFGGYSAIVAVYLAIAGFSPRAAAPASTATTEDAA
ncbi:MAG: acyl-CoA synthetase [Microbacterium sp.]